MSSNLKTIMAKAIILKSNGAFSIQAKPRKLHASIGVPVSGAVDKKAAQAVNKLLDNSKNAPVLEWALLGPQIQFSEPTYIAISTFSKQTTLNGKTLRANEKTFVPAKSILKLGFNSNKVYTYLAIQDGFQTDKILGSKSTLPSYDSSPESKPNISLTYRGLQTNFIACNRPIFDLPSLTHNRLVRIIKLQKGPDYDLLDKQQKHQLAGYFTLSNQRNRMGIQIQESLPKPLPGMLSVPVVPGTIQLTPSGKMIILGNDCQTTGGYPRILWLSSKSLCTLYQLPSGIKFKFEISDYS